MVACENGHTTIVQNLLQNKANINAQDQNGWTPLYFACYYGKTENVHVLLNSNADPNIHNNDNESPLMAAWAKGHVQIVKIMLQVIYICFALGTSMYYVSRFLGFFDPPPLVIKSKHLAWPPISIT